MNEMKLGGEVCVKPQQMNHESGFEFSLRVDGGGLIFGVCVRDLGGIESVKDRVEVGDRVEVVGILSVKQEFIGGHKTGVPIMELKNYSIKKKGEKDGE